jgi:hypothetical protein
MLTDPEDPLLSDSEDALAVIVKPAVVTNVAPWAVSGTTPPGVLGFTTETHVVVPLTLLLLQPVGYDIGVPVVVPTILYLILNSRPVVGLEVMKPIAASARRTTPVDVFVEFARMKVPCPEKTLPAALTPNGLITAGSA